MIGFLCVNKKAGDTSCYCVNKIKKKIKLKCGHLGTLDPLASGVLPIGIGQATRLFDTLLDKVKVYRAVFDFAFTTPSLDLETEPNNYSNLIPSLSDIEKVLPSLVGDIAQVPPDFSAKFIDGKRSYKLARQGIEVSLPPKNVKIYSIKILSKLSETSYEFEIKCGGGTYIRSIVRDMATQLNCYGVMTKLTRIRSGIFSIDNSVTIDEILAADSVEKFLIKPEDVIDYPKIVLDKTKAKRLLDGLKDSCEYPNGLYKVFNEDEFWGIGEVNFGILKMKVYVRDL